MPTRVGVVSDTHLPRFGRRLPGALVRGLVDARVERIFHLGDFTADFVPDLFESIAPLDAVAGNNDRPELVERFGRRRVVDVEGVRFGLTHGDLGPGQTTTERAARSFGADEVDVVLCGHSHIPVVTDLGDGRRHLNPGSPTDKRRQAAYSWGLVEVDAGRVTRVELRWFDCR